LRVYLSVPIIANRDAGRARVMARAILDSGNEVTSPWVLDPMEGGHSPTPNVFVRDKGGVETSDVVVADVSKPSTGVGMEVMAAHSLGKRVIVVIAKGSVVSGMVLQMEPKQTIEFGSEEQLYNDLLRALRSVKPS